MGRLLDWLFRVLGPVPKPLHDFDEEDPQLYEADVPGTISEVVARNGRRHHGRDSNVSAERPGIRA